jgi:hypothetical protein
LTGSGNVYNIAVIPVNQGDVTVSVAEFDTYLIGTAPVTVPIYMDTSDPISFTATQIGGSANVADTVSIRLSFSKAVSGLTADHITITNGTGSATKGALSGSGSTYNIAITVLEQGNVTVMVADFGGYTVTTTGGRVVAIYKQAVAVEINPSAISLYAGDSEQFTATVTGSSNTAVTFSVVTEGGGTISPSGMYTAPATPGTYIVRATSDADTTKWADATVTVVEASTTGINVTPPGVTLFVGSTQQFAATLTGGGSVAVDWTATGGTISSTGFYTAPATAGLYRVKATSQADDAVYGEATVTVVNHPVTFTVEQIGGAMDMTDTTGIRILFNQAVTGLQASHITLSNGTGAALKGNLSGSGDTYTLGITVQQQGTIHVGISNFPNFVVATSAQPVNIFKSSISGYITINNAVPALFTGQGYTFQATLHDYEGTGTIRWSVDGGGSIVETSGLYAPPSEPADVIITATCVQEPSITLSIPVRIRPAAMTNFDGNSPSNPSLLGMAHAYGSTADADIDKYDLTGDHKIDDEDIEMLFRAMAW